MLGIGAPELVIIIIIGALLFGAPLLTFFVGYAVGRNRSRAAEPPPAATPAEEPLDE